MYDTDDFPKENIDAVFVLCEENSNNYRQYHAIWSNQCVELWYLLHFSFMQSDLHRKEYFPKLDECLQSINAGKYEKNREDMYHVLKPYMDVAIRNAKALREINKDKLPSESSPGTMIFEFVEKIKSYL